MNIKDLTKRDYAKKEFGNNLPNAENAPSAFLSVEERIEQHKKKEELKYLILKLCRYVHEDPDYTKEYIEDRLHALANNLDAAITCFRDLVLQFQPPFITHGKLCRPKQNICYCRKDAPNDKDP